MRSKDIQRERWLFGITVAVLFFSFSFNIFGLGTSVDWILKFDPTSDSIVRHTVECKGDGVLYDGPIVDLKKTPDVCDSTSTTPYVSQFGLQARLLRLFGPADNSQVGKYLIGAKLILSLCTALVFAFIVKRVVKEFGLTSGVTVMLLVAVSPWVVILASHIYWTLPLLLAPFALVFCWYPWFKKKNKLPILYLVVLLLFTLKMMDGYEHITTMAVSVLAAIVYYEFHREKRSYFLLARHAVTIGLITTLALVLSVTANVIGLDGYYHDSGKSFTAIRDRASMRASAGGLRALGPNVMWALQFTLPDVYNTIGVYHDLKSLEEGESSSTTYISISALNYLLLPAVQLPVKLNGLFGVITQSMLIIGGGGMVLMYRLRHTSKKIERLFAASLVALAGSLSWLIMMPAHALPHPFINGIVFYLPFLLFVFASYGIFVERIIHKVKSSVAERK